ncbi:hypothetical protein ACFQ6N_35260 [Kitasatospora sp. NPDC056446]|uniref:hypothetical protein n=1 Tax=Kitasatospora sp. NPDC056446 TaxID=3345819 RepID=UPI0036889ACD
MTFTLLFLLALVATIVGTTGLLVRREQARRLHSDDVEGMLIERQRTARAASLRTTYSSMAVHHGTGLVADDVYRHQA